MSTAPQHDALLERAWAALPPEYRMPAVKPTLAEAQAWCQRLAESHYENFHVASWFLPKRLRPHFHSIYAYCRVSDDLGDETGDREQSLALLDFWGEELDACYRGVARHPVFVALAATIEACAIPKEPFADLLVAFRQDQTVTRFATIDEVLAYCRYSANPVGRLSDQTCTGLQLANFWQDVASDYTQRGRIYFPQADMARFKVTEEMIQAGQATEQFRELMRYEVGYARILFRNGQPLTKMVDRELAVDLDLFSRGGLEILRAIEKQGYDVLRKRPSLSKPRKAALLVRAVAGKIFRGTGGRP
jgi:squalene synthase HpnC